MVNAATPWGKAVPVDPPEETTEIPEGLQLAACPTDDINANALRSINTFFIVFILFLVIPAFAGMTY